MIVTDLFESAPPPGGQNPYGYEVGQTVKLQNGSQGRVLDIFDDSIEVLLPGGQTATVDFRDAEVLDESGQQAKFDPVSGLPVSGQLAELEGDATQFATPTQSTPVTDQPPRRGYTITLVGKPGRDYQAIDAWNALAKVFPRDYPPVDRYGNGPAQQKVYEVATRGFAVVKTGIGSEDIAETLVSKLTRFKVPAEFWQITSEELDENVFEGRKVFTEGRHNKLLKENVTYRKFHRLSRLLAERRMSEKEILDLFAAVEQGANDTGQNRTALGRGKDAVAGAYTSAKNAISGVLNSIQMSTPVAGVDAAYNDATGALRDAIGTDSKVMDSIKKYRLLAKEYPKTQLFVKTALIALAGLATGGAGLPAIAGLTAAVDAAIKGEKLSSLIGKGAGAALMAYGAQEVQSMLSGGAAPAGATATGTRPGVMDYSYDNFITANPTTTLTQAEFAARQAAGTLGSSGTNLGAVSALDSLSPGESIVNTDTPLPQGATVRCPLGSCNGNVWQAEPGQTLTDIAQQIGVPPEELAKLNPGLTSPGGAYTVMKGDQLGFIAQAQGTTPEAIRAANPDIDFAKALQPGQQLNLPSANTNTGSLWKDYQGGMYGDKAAGPEQLGSVNTSSAADAAAPAGPTNLAPNFDPNNVPPGMKIRYAPPPVRESVKLIKLPADQLIDQNLTVMAWALNESVGKPPARNMHLTRRGVLTVIENVDRYRRALLKEFDAAGPDRTNIPAVPRQDMPLASQDGAVKPGAIGRGLNWLDKATGKVGGYLSKQAQNFTRKVTAAKLKTEWEQLGHITDSDEIAAFLAKQGVPQGVITDVYGKMGIPYTEPVAAPVGGAQRQAYAGTNPATGKPWTGDELRAKHFPTASEVPDDTTAGDAVSPAATPAPTTATASTTATAAPTKPFQIPGAVTNPSPVKPAATTTTTAAGTFPGEDPKGPNYVGRLEVKRRQAARDAEAAKKPAATATPNFGQQMTGYNSVNYAPNIKTGINVPKPAGAPAPTAPVTKVTSGGPTAAEKDKLAQRIAQAVKEPVAEMLQMVETKEDVQKIKQFVDQTFVRYGAVNESAFAVRNQILEHVTQVGAQRRRDIAAQRAH